MKSPNMDDYFESPRTNEAFGSFDKLLHPDLLGSREKCMNAFYSSLNWPKTKVTVRNAQKGNFSEKCLKCFGKNCEITVRNSTLYSTFLGRFFLEPTLFLTIFLI
jgi:hypothetical protein